MDPTSINVENIFNGDLYSYKGMTSNYGFYVKDGPGTGSTTYALIDGTGNISTTSTISATGNITSSALLSGANISTAGTVTATGNITSSALLSGANISTAGTVTATGNISS